MSCCDEIHVTWMSRWFKIFTWIFSVSMILVSTNHIYVKLHTVFIRNGFQLESHMSHFNFEAETVYKGVNNINMKSWVVFLVTIQIQNQQQQ